MAPRHSGTAAARANVLWNRVTDVATLVVVMGPDFSNNVARMTHALNARQLVLCKLPGYCHGRFSGILDDLISHLFQVKWCRLTP